MSVISMRQATCVFSTWGQNLTSSTSKCDLPHEQSALAATPARQVRQDVRRLLHHALSDPPSSALQALAHAQCSSASNRATRSYNRSPMASSPGYTVLARRYRSGNFDELIGQEHIAQTLKKAIESGRIAHAYLFCGTRGTGKTSTARILAKCLNCESSKQPTANPCGKC